MSTLTTFRLADPLGVFLTEIANYASYTYVLNCSPGQVGVLELELPQSFNTALLLRDGRIGPWRSISGRTPYNDNGAQYTIETIRYTSTSTLVRAYHATGLMDRRIIAYAAGSAYASKAATFADDQIKTFWKENAGASISSADRDGVETQADLSAYITTQANLGTGASVAKAAARRSLLAVAQELAEASSTAGTYLTFEIIAPTEGTLELRTYTTQRGVDRRASTSSPVILREQHRLGSRDGFHIKLSQQRSRASRKQAYGSRYSDCRGSRDRSGYISGRCRVRGDYRNVAKGRPDGG